MRTKLASLSKYLTRKHAFLLWHHRGQNRPFLSICGVLTLRHDGGKHAWANYEQEKLVKIRDHLMKYVIN